MFSAQLNSRFRGILVGAIFSSSVIGHVAAQEQPIPVGLDAYRQWDRWDEQRIGMRASMRSTYDRRGGNEGADASHFLYQLSDDFNVTLDLERPGILMFRRFNHWHGSPWHFVVDGRDNLVEETNTADPLHPAQDSTFLPLASFPSPLNLTWATTNGADLMGTPIPFERSFQMAYTRTHYGTGYYIYVQFVPGTPMSHPIESWSESAAANPDQHDSGQYEDVLDLISKSGSDIAPTTGTHQASGKNALQFGSQQVLVRGHFWWGKEGSMVYDSGYKAILRLEYSPTCNAKYPGLSILRLSRGRNLATITGRLRIDPGGRVTLVADDIQFSDK